MEIYSERERFSIPPSNHSFAHLMVQANRQLQRCIQRLQIGGPDIIKAWFNQRKHFERISRPPGMA